MMQLSAMLKESHTIEIKVSASGISSEIWGCLPSPLVVGRINILVSWTEVLVLLVVGQSEVICLCQRVLPQAFSYFHFLEVFVLYEM